MRISEITNFNDFKKLTNSFSIFLRSLNRDRNLRVSASDDRIDAMAASRWRPRGNK